jgi:hypothetical protein
VKHPNTFAAVVAGAFTGGTQWLLQRYGQVGLSPYWQQVLNGVVVAAVLYVGRDGIKAALVRLWNGPKTAWKGAGASS